MDFRLALTGPSGAARYGLDGFRTGIWPMSWCTPHDGRTGERIVRTRTWSLPTSVDGMMISPKSVIARHLNAFPADLLAYADELSPRDRVELAVEHLLRDNVPIRPARGGSQPGDALLREVLRLRGSEPPTESFAETRALQLFRSWGMDVFRQIPILQFAKVTHRADFLVPHRAMRRPAGFAPSMGTLIEIDSREFHEFEFVKDQHRNATYNRLGYNWVSFTPTQIENEPAFVRESLAGALSRIGQRLLSA